MIAIACDHAAYEFKEKLKKYLSQKNYQYKDYGCLSPESVDYPDYAILAAKAVASKECDIGIVMCGTGIGMSIAANKIRGIRCALCSDEFSAKATREHNDANMLSLGVRVLDEEKALRLVDIFLSTPFSSDERHMRRVQKITQIEQI